MIGQRLTLLLCCATLCWAQDNWEWPCGNVTAQEGVNISQILGRWYTVARYIANETVDGFCVGAEFSDLSGNNTKIHLEYGLIYWRGFVPLREMNFTVVTPSKWRNGEDSVAVIDLPPEGNTLTISRCWNATIRGSPISLQEVNIFSKTRTPDLNPIHSRLREGDFSHWSFTDVAIQCTRSFV